MTLVEQRKQVARRVSRLTGPRIDSIISYIIYWWGKDYVPCAETVIECLYNDEWES